MALGELPAPFIPKIESHIDEQGIYITGTTYSLHFIHGKPYIDLCDATGCLWAQLYAGGAIDTRESPDETLSFGEYTIEQTDECLTICQSLESTAWQSKTLVWECRRDSVNLHYELVGEGRLVNCTYLGGSHTKELDSGYFPSLPLFQSVFNPEPMCTERRTYGAGESSAIDVTGLALPGRDNWFATPPPYCFGVALEHPNSDGSLAPVTSTKWLMMGLISPIERQHFTSFEYRGQSGGFALQLQYEDQTTVNGPFSTPELQFRFAPDPYTGIREHAAEVRSTQPITLIQTEPTPRWWQKPIFCGWGVQAEEAHRALAGKAPDYAYQELYDRHLGLLAERGIVPGTIIIDDKWQQTYGGNMVDLLKWPDIGSWIEGRHRVGQKVLLWYKAWDAEGLDPELCVRTSDGRAVTTDPSNPAYRELLRSQVRHMLGTDGYGADGLKIDFTARTPSGRTLQRYGTEWGTSLLHRLLETIYDSAKDTKQDALIITHTPNPYFADVTDMIRLNDINCGTPVIEQMIHRQRIAHAALPDKLIDTDNWPMPSIEAWRSYRSIQRALGVPALYFSTHVAGSPMDDDDYRALRRLFGEPS